MLDKFVLQTGRYRVNFVTSDHEIAAGQRLRHRLFRSEKDDIDVNQARDQDSFDRQCQHLLVRDVADDALVAYARLNLIEQCSDIDCKSYSGQYYDLQRLKAFDAPAVELGRFCVAPERKDPDILRLLWGAITQFVEHHEAKLLFGCTSFQGVDALSYTDSFVVLRQRHAAPKRWMPRIKAPHVIRFPQIMRRKPDLKRAMALMPPLLRSYLLLGGWVSDHAVVDNDLNTIHVFTGLEIATIPSRRARILRDISARVRVPIDPNGMLA